MPDNRDTIVAIATPPGKGGVGVIRISGPDAYPLGEKVTNRPLPERLAQVVNFRDANKQTIDTGIAIYFKGPKSFTGEDVVEFQGHGGPIIQDLLLCELIRLGARQARAGEFSERAFLNDKMDLAQAEAIADLIDSSTEQAARGAIRSLQGEFSNKVQKLLQQLIHIRMYVEAAIDFPEEEIDFLADKNVIDNIVGLQASLAETIAQAGQGAILRNGLSVVLAGKPNAGKSSLINALSGIDAAIVTDTPGTTRDTVRETIDIDGMPVHIIDTAGLRESTDEVEIIGVERARKAMQEADHILYLVDSTQAHEVENSELEDKTTLVMNKVDLLDGTHKKQAGGLMISATRGDGLEELRAYLKKLAGYQSDGESIFSARRRHLTALYAAQNAVQKGLDQLRDHKAGELLADELLYAQNALNQITGEFSADDLLGEIFAGFCIGK